MPGRPRHPLGPVWTVVIAATAATLTTVAAESLTSVGLSVAVGGVGYVTGLLGVWAVARRLFHHFDRDWRTGLWLGITAVVLGIQWALPVTTGVVFDSVVTSVWLFAVTALAAWTFSRVGGEGSILFVWPLVVAPVAFGVLLLLLAGELVVVPWVVDQFGPTATELW